MMHDHDHTPLDPRLTRRRVVKTALKAGYAAPVIAASFHLAAIDARAQDDQISGTFCVAATLIPCGTFDIDEAKCIVTKPCPRGVACVPSISPTAPCFCNC